MGDVQAEAHIVEQEIVRLQRIVGDTAAGCHFEQPVDLRRESPVSLGASKPRHGEPEDHGGKPLKPATSHASAGREPASGGISQCPLGEQALRDVEVVLDLAEFGERVAA